MPFLHIHASKHGIPTVPHPLATALKDRGSADKVRRRTAIPGPLFPSTLNRDRQHYWHVLLDVLAQPVPRQRKGAQGGVKRWRTNRGQTRDLSLTQPARK